MATELEELAARLQRVEDELAIRRVILSYGPAADAGLAERAGGLWAGDGAYDWDRDRAALEGPAAVARMLEGDAHQSLIANGVAHFAGPPLVEVDGDHATALSYSFVLRRDDDQRVYVWRLGARRGGSSPGPTARGGSSVGHIASSTRPARDASSSATRCAPDSRRTCDERATRGQGGDHHRCEHGIGSGHGEALRRRRRRVLLAARREELVREAAVACGERAIAVRADVTVEDDVVAMVGRAVEEYGQVDIMCNNAAAPGTDRFIWEQTLENWNATIAIDVTAAMLCTREVLNQSMLERGTGVILNFSSTAGFNGVPRKTHYVTAKASLRAFTKAVALEVGRHGIRCNCIVPGGIDTELWRNWVHRMADEQGVDDESMRTKMLASVPLRDISSTDDVANLALFLASDEARTITGQSVVVDAGSYMLG